MQQIPKSLIDYITALEGVTDREGSERIYVDCNKGLTCEQRILLREKSLEMRDHGRSHDSLGYGKGKGKKIKTKHGRCSQTTKFNLSFDIPGLIDSGVYEPTGSLIKPFRTITDAILYLKTERKNCIDNPSMIKIFPGIYNEDIFLDDDTFKYMSFSGASKYIGLDVVLNGKVVCKKGNDNFRKLLIEGMHIKGGVEIEGESDGTKAFSTDLVFHTCLIDGPCSVKNVMVAVFVDCKTMSNMDIENVKLFSVRGAPGHAANLKVVYDASKKKCENYSQVLLDNTILVGSFEAERVGTQGTIYVQPRRYSRIASPGKVLKGSEGCVLMDYGFVLRGSIDWKGSVTGLGSFFNNNGTSLTSNDVQGAIKELEARIAALESA